MDVVVTANMLLSLLQVFIQDGSVMLGKAHPCFVSCLSSVWKDTIETEPCWLDWTQAVLELRLQGETLSASFLHFYKVCVDNQCFDALACLCLESFTSLTALLPWQAVDQLWCVLCLSIYLPVHSRWFWHGRAVDPLLYSQLFPRAVHGHVPVRAAHFRLQFLAAGSWSPQEWWHEWL